MMGAAAGMPAVANEAVYTKLVIDQCEKTEEAEGGAAFRCPGLAGYDIHLQVGDLRESVHFGPVGSWYAQGVWESFGEWNLGNDTIEWRVGPNGRPTATIQRFFIDNIDPNTGSADPARRGQVLVISRVAQPDDGLGCVAGYVDARAAENANLLARQIADNLAPAFPCRQQLPQFHGARGPNSGSPSSWFAAND